MSGEEDGGFGCITKRPIKVRMAVMSLKKKILEKELKENDSEPSQFEDGSTEKVIDEEGSEFDKEESDDAYKNFL